MAECDAFRQALQDMAQKYGHLTRGHRRPIDPRQSSTPTTEISDARTDRLGGTVYDSNGQAIVYRYG